MNKFTTLISAVALSAALAGSASAQVVAEGAPGSLPPAVQQLIANAGGVGVVAAVTVVVIGALLIVTITKNDGTTVTTTITTP